MANDPIRLLDLCPELGDRLPDAQRDEAARELVTRLVRIRPGRWSPERMVGAPSRSLSLMVVDGLLMRDVELGRRSGTEVLGAGDLIRPWEQDGAQDAIALSVRWTAVEEVGLAVIGDRLLQAAGRYPTVLDALLARADARHRGLAMRLVVNQLVRLEDRLVLGLWMLAHRWGRITEQGMLVPVPLTHSALGRLVGARRPSVTSAIGGLVRDGAVERTPEGWLLRGDAATIVDPLSERLSTFG